MRIAIPMPAPVPVPPAAPAGLDRAALAQVAAIAAGTPWQALDALVAEHGRAAPAGPAGFVATAVVPPQPPPALPAGAAAAVSAVLQGTAAALPSLGRVPAAATGPVAAALAASPLPALALRAAGGDRLTLSPALATTAAAPLPAAGRGPVGDVLGRLLTGLTGEGQGQVTVTVLGSAQLPSPPLPTTRGPQDLLQLLVRAVAVGSDRQAVDLTLGLHLLRQASAAVSVDARVLDAVRAALEQLASREIDLELPVSSSALAGQSVRFQAQFDPAALWPMQSFLLSGLLIFGRARPVIDDAPVDDVDDADGQPAAHDDDAREDRDSSSQQQPMAEAESADLPTPLPADGGAPFISASRWLELELRHWRVQVQRWMALPVDAPRNSKAGSGRVSAAGLGAATTP